MFHNVVALYGVPRSGTSWLGQILDSCPEAAFRFQPLFSYQFRNRITTESTREDIEKFFTELYLEDNNDFLTQASERKKGGSYPIFEKKVQEPSILAYKEARYLYTIPLLLKRYEEIKIIGIVRNPYDVLESWINASKEYKPEWNLYEEWNFAASKNEYRPENYYGYNKWKEFIKMCVDMKIVYPQNFSVVRYEDLESDALAVAKDLFTFAEMPWTEQTRTFIIDSQSRSVEDCYGVYREKNSQRKRQYFLPQEIRDMITKDLSEFKEAREFDY